MIIGDIHITYISPQPAATNQERDKNKLRGSHIRILWPMNDHRWFLYASRQPAASIQGEDHNYPTNKKHIGKIILTSFSAKDE